MKNRGPLREFTKYTSLNILGMIGLSCYILADTFFVSQGLGANGLTALNLAIPVYSFIHGSGLMLGMGGATKYSILKSQGEERQADQAFTHTVACAAGFALLFFAAGLFLSEGIARSLGADAAVFSMSKTYLQVLLLFAPLFLLNNVLLCFVRNDGSPALSTVAMMAGSLSNIVLDYVFMFPLGMGIFGAVLATGLAPVVSLLVLSPYFFAKRNRFRLARCKPSGILMRAILSGGVPSLITEVSSGVVMIAFNTIILRLLGNVGVAAYGVISNLSLVVIAVYTGIAQGIQPVVSRAHGAGNIGKIQAVLRYALILMACISAVIYAGVLLGAEWITAAFNSEGNEVLRSIAVTGMRVYFTACVFCGCNVILSVYFTAAECTRPAHIISLLRGFVLILPLAFLLSAVGGIIGVWCAFPLTEMVTSIFAVASYTLAKRRTLGLQSTPVIGSL